MQGRAAQIVALLGQGPRDATSIAQEFGLPLDEILPVCAALWAAKILQGDVASGCCQDPCGIACIVARRIDRRWQLTRKGLSALRHFQSRS